MIKGGSYEKLFTDEQKQYILDNYEKMKYKDIAKNLGTEFTATQITGWIHNQKLKKTNRSMYSLRLLDLLYYDDNIQKLDRKYQKYLLLKQQGSPYQK